MSTRRLNSSSQSLLSFTSLIHRDTNGRVNAFAPGAPSRHYYTRALAYNFIRKTLRSNIKVDYIYLKMWHSPAGVVNNQEPDRGLLRSYISIYVLTPYTYTVSFIGRKFLLYACLLIITFVPSKVFIFRCFYHYHDACCNSKRFQKAPVTIFNRLLKVNLKVSEILSSLQ